MKLNNMLPNNQYILEEMEKTIQNKGQILLLNIGYRSNKQMKHMLSSGFKVPDPQCEDADGARDIQHFIVQKLFTGLPPRTTNNYMHNFTQI